MVKEADNHSHLNLLCYAPTMITTHGIWQGDNPLDYSLPLFILQLTIIVVTTRILVFILKPLRQPRVISEILGGIILGPSVLGRNKTFAFMVFPLRSVLILETIANLGLLYFLFLVGLEMDLTVIRRTGKQALAIAISGMVLPFLIGVSFSFRITKETQVIRQGTFVLFLGVSLCITAFPVLARILAELKLLNTDLGKIAMSSALINDVCAWVLLAFAITLAENDTIPLATLWVFLSCAAFVCFCIFVVRPLIEMVIQQTPEGETVNEIYICLILSGVTISGFVTDAIGTHAVFGAFVFGLVIPNGPLSLSLIEKLEDFVSGLLLPLFFATSGLKTEITAIEGLGTWSILAVVIILSCAGKVAGTLLVALYYKMPFKEGLTLGLLMNAKGLIEMIVLNVGKDQQVLDSEAFAIMIVVALIMTAIISPLVTVVYKPAKQFIPYKRRSVQRTKPDSEFRISVCVHTPRNVPTIINLLEATNPTKRSPICVYVCHLVELTGRASAMLIVHNNRNANRQPLNCTQAQSDHIINAFENFEQHADGGVSVQPHTVMSPYSTMHEDICSFAEDKRVAIVIIPFHKQQTVDGGMESTNPAYRAINQNVLANAPCSVGILVDRGLSGSTRLAASEVSHHVAVLFFSGPDDREALAYAWRMSDHPGISLTVMRFLPGDSAVEPLESDSMRNNNTKTSGVLTVVTNTDTDREKQLDEDYINQFRAKTADNETVAYTEVVINNGEETVAAIRSIDSMHDLFIVGRGQGNISPLTAGLTDWSECPELGAIGDLLASTDFASTVSVLVVQQYVEIGNDADSLSTPDTPTNQNGPFDGGSFANRRTPTASASLAYHPQP
nr:cation/H(+) antiporter 15-like [Ipomoea batatas]